MEDEEVKWPSKKKWPCKKNKGEHEYLEPTVYMGPSIVYIHETERGTRYSKELLKEYKLLRTELSVFYECRCKHCYHKYMVMLTDKIK